VSAIAGGDPLVGSKGIGGSDAGKEGHVQPSPHVIGKPGRVKTPIVSTGTSSPQQLNVLMQIWTTTSGNYAERT